MSDKVQNPTFFLSANNLVSQENAVRHISWLLVKQHGRAVKIISCLEKLKQDIQNLCTKYIGINPYSEEPFDTKTLKPLVDGYKETMERLDPDWWKESIIHYMPKIQESLVDGVIYICKGCNEIAFIEAAAELNCPIIRIEGSENNNQKGFLSKSIFKKNSKKQEVFHFSCPDDQLIEDKEDLNEKFLSKLDTILVKQGLKGK